MKWDYNLSGDSWNHLPLKTQMEYLEKYYPIGAIFHEKQPNPNMPDSVKDVEKYYCIIKDYSLTEVKKRPHLTSKSEWYILSVENVNNPFVNKYEAKHPVFYTPSKSFLRNNKINQILK